MAADIKPIGIFDSGVGGLTVAKEIMAVLPHQPLVYFGDCINAPYGNRTDDELLGFSQRIINFLLEKDVGAIVVACGTISTRIFAELGQFVPGHIPLYEMLTAGVQAVTEASKTGKIGVIATEGSVKSGAFEREILKARPDAMVKSVACPLLVPLVEEGWAGGEVADLVAKEYLKDLAESDVDTLLLGCTHYPLLSDSIAKSLPNATLINPANHVAENLRNCVNYASASPEKPKHQFYTTAKKEKFDKIAKNILPAFDKPSILV
ncbi:MAG: glutamate racemase [Defluviitaleaceae bacterium]|nr:glutamate racemase [Defluviitaleaceae bacterium]